MKMNILFKAAVILIVAGALNTAAGATIPFDLSGKAGSGLLIGNENPTVANGGSGGEVGAGITFDDVTLQLTVNIAWGSGNGFTDLTGNATAGHIHGPTTDPAPTSFTESAGVLIGLDTLAGWNASASSGGVSGTVNIPSGNVADLFAGKLYINIHTSTNGGGEIRGYLLSVPEPGSVALLVLAGAGALTTLVWKRVRR